MNDNAFADVPPLTDVNLIQCLLRAAEESRDHCPEKYQHYYAELAAHYECMLRRTRLRLMQYEGHALLTLSSGSRVYGAESYASKDAPCGYLSGCLSLSGPSLDLPYWIRTYQDPHTGGWIRQYLTLDGRWTNVSTYGTREAALQL